MEFLKSLFKRKPTVEKVDLRRRYDLIGRVGQGSMSKVWRAKDALTGRMVALKVLDKEKTKRLEQRFVGMDKPTEGELAIQLKHPHIVLTIEHGITIEDEQYLVMEFVEGVGLSYLVDTQNDRMKQHRLRYMIQLGDAIDYVHKQGYIHRDICPRNVLINQDDQIKLIDFGLAVPNTAKFQAPGNRTGTANYMAPELILRKKTDQRIDIFSYAVTCYEMCTKRLPWPAGDSFENALQHVNSDADDIFIYHPGLDRQIGEAIMKGLERNPDQRWQTIRQMTQEFRSAEQRIKKSE